MQILGTCAIFAIVHTEIDYFYVPLIYSSVQIISGCIATYYLFKKYGLSFGWPSATAIRKELSNGFRIFLSSSAITFYITSNTIILGIFASIEVVGWYSAGEKILRAIRTLINPFVVVLYPHISRIAQKSFNEAKSLLRKILRIGYSLSLCLSLVLFFLSDTITHVILGPAFDQTSILLKILCPLPIIFVALGVYADLYLLGFGYQRIWSRIVIVTGILNLAINLFFVGILSLGHIGAGLSLVCTELIVAVWSFVEWNKTGKSFVYE